MTLLTDDGRSQNDGVGVEHEGGAASLTDRRGGNGADRDIYVMDPADPKSDKLLMQVTGGGWGVTRLVARRHSAARAGVPLDRQDEHRVVDVVTGQKSPLTQSMPKRSRTGAVFAADGRGVYVTSDKESEFQRLGYIDLATKQFTSLTTHLKWDVEGFELSPDGKTIAFATNEAGVVQALSVRYCHTACAPGPGRSRRRIGSLAWHKNSRDWRSRSAAPVRRRTFTRSTRLTAAISRWTESELGGLVASELSRAGADPMEELRRPRDQRLLLSGAREVHRQASGDHQHPWRPGGAVASGVHRPESTTTSNELGVSRDLSERARLDRVRQELRRARQRHEARGFGARTSARCSTGSPRGRNSTPARIMVTGGSYGGYMTLAVSTHYSSRLRAAVDVVGISNFGTFLKNTESYRRDLRRAEYGDERDPKMVDFFEKIAPLNNAQKIEHPLFVVQGGNDPRVPLSEAEQIVKNGQAERQAGLVPDG